MADGRDEASDGSDENCYGSDEIYVTCNLLKIRDIRYCAGLAQGAGSAFLLAYYWFILRHSLRAA